MTQHEAIELLSGKGKVNLLEFGEDGASIKVKAGNATLTLYYSVDLDDETVSFSENYDAPVQQFEPFLHDGCLYEEIGEVVYKVADIYETNGCFDNDIEELKRELEREADDIEDTNNSLWSQWSPRD